MRLITMKVTRDNMINTVKGMEFLSQVGTIQLKGDHQKQRHTFPTLTLRLR
jgi:hypothetical protein